MKLTPVLLLGLLCLSTRLLAQIEVTNTNDAGAGSLRQAITDANASAAQETITFNIPTAGPWIINLESELPNIANYQWNGHQRP